MTNSLLNDFNIMCRKNSKFYIPYLNAFSFPVNVISIHENIKYETYNSTLEISLKTKFLSLVICFN